VCCACAPADAHADENRGPSTRRGLFMRADRLPAFSPSAPLPLSILRTLDCPACAARCPPHSQLRAAPLPVVPRPARWPGWRQRSWRAAASPRLPVREPVLYGVAVPMCTHLYPCGTHGWRPRCGAGRLTEQQQHQRSCSLLSQPKIAPSFTARTERCLCGNSCVNSMPS
jgi:hypothetical protein